jgi:hypothetical protein
MVMAATTSVVAAMVTARDGCIEGHCVGDAAVAAVTAASTTVVKAVARRGRRRWLQRMRLRRLRRWWWPREWRWPLYIGGLV